MRRCGPLSITIMAVLLVAACGSDARSQPDAPSQTTTVAIPGTEAARASTGAPTTEMPGTTAEILVAEDVVYHADDDGDWTMDVFYPSAAGPWPLVVVYHGMTTTAAAATARQIAGRGAVAVAPQWLKATPPRLTGEVYIDGALLDRAACAATEAQRIASDYGGDSSNTNVAGYSAGVHPAAWIGLGVVRNDVCRTALVHTPVGVILGDNQFIFFDATWDDSLADPDSVGADTLDRFVNPERWNVADDVAVYLWTSGYRYGRVIENPPTADSWLLDRDTTGTLIDDLASVGAFDDEWIGWMDNAHLMELRLSASGIDVVHEAVGGGHTYNTKVYDAIEELISRK